MLHQNKIRLTMPEQNYREDQTFDTGRCVRIAHSRAVSLSGNLIRYSSDRFIRPICCFLFHWNCRFYLRWMARKYRIKFMNLSGTHRLVGINSSQVCELALSHRLGGILGPFRAYLGGLVRTLARRLCEQITP